MTETIYYHGTILTMEEEQPTAEAILTENGKIKKIGSFSEIKEGKKQGTKMVDLEGHTLMPAFLDAHSHITAYASTLSAVNLQDATCFAEIVEKMKTYIKKTKPKKGQWIIGFGYDQNALKEKDHPNKQVLDQITKEFPLTIAHASGHMGVFNSKALALAAIDTEKENPQGGIIGREEDGMTPNGYLEENAFMSASSIIPESTMEQRKKWMEMAQKDYLKYGITTAQDGLTKGEEWSLLKTMAEENKLEIDIVSYLDQKNHAGLVEENPKYDGKYDNHLKIGGYKIFLDGSPQGRTAWLTQPYKNGEKGYCGYPIYEKEQVSAFIRQALEEKRQLLAHCNGDAACEQYISCLEEVSNSQNNRFVMIHAQMVRPDQLKRMKKLEMIPSFFIAHVFQWGDIHLINLGKERAEQISPAKTAEELGLVYTFHQDTPVLLPDMMKTIWCAVNRVTKEGVLLGKKEQLTVIEALKAVTINTAYQYFEEKEKGSLKIGKNADFVILNKNPLESDPMALKEIQILQTIKNGKC